MTDVTSAAARPAIILWRLLVLSTLCLGVVACTGTNSSSSSASVEPLSPSGEITTQVDAYMASVDAAQDPEAVVSVPARPTVVQGPEGRQTMVIRDEDAGTWPAGAYRLVVRCAGEGVIVGHFGLGEKSVIRTLAPCHATTSTDSLELTLDQPAQQSLVVLVPAGESMAAVGYQIERIS